MCTVTYLPLGKNNFILTSSRDVPYSRKKALKPKNFIEDAVELTYPKDGKAGGTWIGISSKKRLICLLNGGFENHTPKKSYRKSRGVIVKDLLKGNDIFSALKTINLKEIEPFTLTIVDWNNQLELIEFVWDGTEKHLKKLKQMPHIWSSSTLYNKDIQQLRRDWFTGWQIENEFSQENILHFHHTAGIENKETAILMDRKTGGTVSITCVKKHEKEINMYYEEVNSRLL